MFRISDYQQSGSDGNTLIYYDAPQYDVFWQTAIELDVPLYFHPRQPAQAEIDLLWKGRPWLIGPAWQFENDLGSHILRSRKQRGVRSLSGTQDYHRA